MKPGLRRDRISFAVNEKERAQVEALAWRLGKSKSAALRYAVRQVLKAISKHDSIANGRDA